MDKDIFIIECPECGVKNRIKSYAPDRIPVCLIFYTMPMFLTFIIPMSVMLAILLTFLRLSSDNEIVAIKSCGMSIYGLLPPVMLFALLGFLLTMLLTLYAGPRSKASLEEMSLKVATTNMDIGLKERTFNDAFKGVMLYVNKIDIQNKKLAIAAQQSM